MRLLKGDLTSGWGRAGVPPGDSVTPGGPKRDGTNWLERFCRIIGAEGPGPKTAIDQVGSGQGWTLGHPGGQRSCPERVGTGELGKAVYISLDGVMAERPPGAPGPRSSQPQGVRTRGGGMPEADKGGWAPRKTP